MRTFLLIIFLVPALLFAKGNQKPVIQEIKEATPESLTRRLYIDLMDRLPTLEEYLETRQKIHNGQYEKVVEDLIKTDEFKLQLAGKVISHYGGRDSAKNYIKKFYMDDDSDFRVFLHDMLTAVGAEKFNPLVSFYVASKPEELSEKIMLKTLGIPVNCARCHDHPEHEGLTQKKVWESAAIFKTMTLMPYGLNDYKTILNGLSKSKTVTEKDAYVFTEAQLTKGETHTDTTFLSKAKRIFKYSQSFKMNENIKMSQVISEVDILNTMKSINIRRSGKDSGSETVFLYEKSSGHRQRLAYEREDEKRKATAKVAFSKLNKAITRKKSNPRYSLAKWVINDENQYTAKAIANWVGFWLHGKGYAEDGLDMYSYSSQINKDLVKYEKLLRENKFNLQKLVKAIVCSQEYKAESFEKQDNKIEMVQRQTRYLSGTQIMKLLNFTTQYNDVNKSTREQLLRSKKVGDEYFTSLYFNSFVLDKENSDNGSLQEAAILAYDPRILIHLKKLAKEAKESTTSFTGTVSLKSSKNWIVETIRKFYTREPTDKEIEYFTTFFKKNAISEKEFFIVIWALTNSPEMRIY